MGYRFVRSLIRWLSVARKIRMNNKKTLKSVKDINLEKLEG